MTRYDKKSAAKATEAIILAYLNLKDASGKFREFGEAKGKLRPMLRNKYDVDEIDLYNEHALARDIWDNERDIAFKDHENAIKAFKDAVNKSSSRLPLNVWISDDCYRIGLVPGPSHTVSCVVLEEDDHGLDVVREAPRPEKVSEFESRFF